MNELCVRISGFEHESVVDGPGIRFVIYTQGCRHKCKGCHNPQTHAFDAGQIFSVDELYQMYLQEDLCDGVTLSGGDPLEQAESLCVLAQQLKLHGVHIVCYTGYTWEYLQQNGTAAQRMLLYNIDLLVDGKYIQAERSLDLLYRGSRNQRIIDVPKSLSTGIIHLFSTK